MYELYNGLYNLFWMLMVEGHCYMHIPDGYLNPLFALGSGVVTVPTWMLAVRRVKKILSHRTLPLLSLFSALAFLVMLVHIPVPGGTTAHMVGGTLIAIVLGPWAAVLCLTTTLILQALFFGDGGVLALFTNSLNLAVLLPFVGYGVYTALAGRSPIQSARRIWAAGIAAYLAFALAALAVGAELGLQPLLFGQFGGFIPYNFTVTIPAMLVSHLLGAGLVEGLLSALVVAYLQRHNSGLLTLYQSSTSDPVDEEILEPVST